MGRPPFRSGAPNLILGYTYACWTHWATCVRCHHPIREGLTNPSEQLADPPRHALCSDCFDVIRRLGDGEPDPALTERSP